MMLEHPALSPIRAAVDRWRAISPRERRLVALALAALAALGLITLGESLAREHAHLRDTLPRVQARQQAVAVAAAEIEELKARPAPADMGDTDAATLTALSALAATRGLNVTLVQAQANGDEGLVHLEGVGEARIVLEWLAEAQALHGVQLLELVLRTRDGPDTLRGQLRLKDG